MQNSFYLRTYGELKTARLVSDSSHDSRLGFISFDGMGSVEVENLSGLRSWELRIRLKNKVAFL